MSLEAILSPPAARLGAGDADADGMLFGVGLSNGQFYNHGMGSDLPPHAAITVSYPSLLCERGSATSPRRR